MDKKGQISELPRVVIGLVTVGLVLVVGFLVMSEGRSQVESIEDARQTSFAGCSLDNGTGCSSAENGTIEVITSMESIPGWLPILVVVVIGGLIVAVVSKFGSGN